MKVPMSARNWDNHLSASEDLPTVPRYPEPCSPGVTYLWGLGHRAAICPRCHVFIVSMSRVVRLYQPEVPNSRDGGRVSADTGRHYRSDGQPINNPHKPRWFVHERCYHRDDPNYVEPTDY